MKRLASLSLVLFFLAVQSSGLAQDPGNSDAADELLESLSKPVLIKTLKNTEAEITRLRGELQKATGVLQAGALANQPVLTSEQLADRIADIRKVREGFLDHTMKVFYWQLVAAYLVLFLVILVVGLGVYLSFFEVRAAVSMRRKAESSQDQQQTPAQQTELTLSLQKIQITSAITGVSVLVISFGFLYLFLERVFDIESISIPL